MLIKCTTENKKNKEQVKSYKKVKIGVANERTKGKVNHNSIFLNNFE